MSLSLNEYDVLFDRTESQSFFLTIAIPTFNRFDLLKEALKSVFEQSFPFAFEVLVIDNNPENKELATKEMSIFSDKAMRYIVNSKNIGMFGNWNQCLLLSRGEYVMLLNDDDLLKPNFSSVLTQFIKNNKINDGIIAFSDEVLDQRKNELKRETFFWLRSARQVNSYLKKSMLPDVSYIVKTDLFFKNYIHGTLAVVFNREMSIKLGGFNADAYPVADWEFWLRWTTIYGPIQKVKSNVAYYRIRENESFNPETLAKFPPAVRRLREDAIASKRLPSFLSYLIPYLDRYECMLGRIGFGDPEKYKFSTFSMLCFYFFMVSQNVFSLILSFFYRKK